MIEISSFVGVIVAAIARVAICMFWYSPKVFGKLWMRLSGISPNKEKMPVAFVGATLMAVIAAAILACFAARMHVETVYSGTMLGLMAWLGFSLPVYMSGFFWSNVPLALALFNAASDLVSLVAMGIIIALL